MDKISQNLRDPEWWFSLVIVGLIVSMLAPLLSKLARRLLAHFSERYRLKQERRKQQWETIAQFWSGDDNLLQVELMSSILTMVKAGIHGITTILMVLMFAHLSTNLLARTFFAAAAIAAAMRFAKSLGGADAHWGMSSRAIEVYEKKFIEASRNKSAE
jgi:hypothetical protein